MTKTIAINAGSSSLKWQLYEMPDEVVLAKGMVSFFRAYILYERCFK